MQQHYPGASPMPKITMLQFLETGTYNPMYYRPYQSHLTPQTMQAFQEMTNGGTNLHTNSVAGIAGEILRPAAQVNQHTDQIVIPGGWTDRRYLFMMEVQAPDPGFGQNVGCRILISGHTDYAGGVSTRNGLSNVTGSGITLDPNMRLFINSIITIRVTERFHPERGHYLEETVVDDSQLLCDDYSLAHGGMGLPGSQYAVAMRPQDVFQTNQASMYNVGGLVDLRTNFAFGVKKSRRQNNLAPSYISRVTSAWQRAQMEGTDTDSEGEISTRAMGYVHDPTTAKDRFLNALQTQTQFSQTGSVTYQELCYLQPDLDLFAEVRYQDKRALMQHHQAGQTESWHGATLEHLMATTLFQAVPALMAKMLIVNTTLMITNRTYGGVFNIVPTTIVGFQRMPIDERRFMMFAEQLRTVVLQDLTRNNAIDIDITLTIDMVGESVAHISISGNPPMTFAVPSFCDAKFTPVVANDRQALHLMAHDIASLCNGIRTQHGPYLSITPPIQIDPRMVAAGASPVTHVDPQQDYKNEV